MTSHRDAYGKTPAGLHRQGEKRSPSAPVGFGLLVARDADDDLGVVKRQIEQSPSKRQVAVSSPAERPTTLAAKARYYLGG